MSFSINLNFLYYPMYSVSKRPSYPEQLEDFRVVGPMPNFADWRMIVWLLAIPRGKKARTQDFLEYFGQRKGGKQQSKMEYSLDLFTHVSYEFDAFHLSWAEQEQRKFTILDRAMIKRGVLKYKFNKDFLDANKENYSRHQELSLYKTFDPLTMRVLEICIPRVYKGRRMVLSPAELRNLIPLKDHPRRAMGKAIESIELIRELFPLSVVIDGPKRKTRLTFIGDYEISVMASSQMGFEVVEPKQEQKKEPEKPKVPLVTQPKQESQPTQEEIEVDRLMEKIPERDRPNVLNLVKRFLYQKDYAYVDAAIGLTNEKRRENWGAYFNKALQCGWAVNRSNGGNGRGGMAEMLSASTNRQKTTIPEEIIILIKDYVKKNPNFLYEAQYLRLQRNRLSEEKKYPGWTEEKENELVDTESKLRGKFSFLGDDFPEEVMEVFAMFCDGEQH